jgi:uncharacterized protein
VIVLYVDTSALVKLYVEESGSDVVRARILTAEHVATSVLAWPETLATLARRRREGLLSAKEHEALGAQFRVDWSALVAVDLDGRVLELVDELVALHPLRGADAVHLASALVLVEAGLYVAFACADRTLAAAARSRRLDVWTPGLA